MVALQGWQGAHHEALLVVELRAARRGQRGHARAEGREVPAEQRLEEGGAEAELR